MFTPRTLYVINKLVTSRLFSNWPILATLYRTFKCAAVDGDGVVSIVIECQVRYRSGEECLKKMSNSTSKRSQREVVLLFWARLYSDVTLTLNLKFFKVPSS